MASKHFKNWLKKIGKIFLILFIAQLVYILILKWVDPPITATQFSSWTSGDGLRRDYVDINDMSPNIRLAVIASEDQLFPDHNGFDIQSIKDAFKEKNKLRKRARGASTISQQVAKNVFLWQGRSWIRKAMEIYFTFMIEWIWGKKRILEMYLNVSEMGKGVYGIEAAAHYYFSKPAKNLSRQEAAEIAGCLPNPKVFTIKPLSKHVAGRYPWILVQMSHLQDDPDIQKLLQ